LSNMRRTRRHVKIESQEPKKIKAESKEIKIEINENSNPIEQKPSTSKYFDEKSDKDCYPEDWEKLLHNIEKMRAKRDAPVDTMGCEECYAKVSSDEEKRFQILVSLLMSSQTNDKINSAAMVRLNDRFGSLKPIDVLSATEAEIAEIIKPVGFYKTKAKNMIKVARICQEQYNGDIPKTIEDLLALPGIGPKMGYLTLQCAWKINDGIGVDVHMHRICQRLNWVHKPKNPEDTRVQLEAWLPKEKWREVNKLLVGFGQQVCKATKPDCENCLNNGICPKTVTVDEKRKKSKKGLY